MVISEGAQSIGTPNARSQVPDSNPDQEIIQSNSQEAAEKIRETARQQRLLLGLPAVIRSISTALLKTTAEQFNDNFIKQLLLKRQLTGREAPKKIPHQVENHQETRGNSILSSL